MNKRSRRKWKRGKQKRNQKKRRMKRNPGSPGTQIKRSVVTFPTKYSFICNNKPLQNNAITDLRTYAQQVVSDFVRPNTIELTLICEKYTAEDLYWSSFQSTEKVQQQTSVFNFPVGFNLSPYIPPPSSATRSPGVPRSVFGDYIPIQQRGRTLVAITYKIHHRSGCIIRERDWRYIPLATTMTGQSNHHPLTRFFHSHLLICTIKIKFNSNLVKNT